jgi:hypothetical protein
MFSNSYAQIDNAYPTIKETIPQTSLGYATNNKYPEFPPLMSDGRSITASWQPEASINADLLQSNNIKSNWQYRRYLTEQSKEIIEYNFREASSDVGYYKRPIDLPNIQSNIYHKELYTSPYSYETVLDKKKPFGYQTSDLKELYLSREQLNARKIAPVITKRDLQK